MLGTVTTIGEAIGEPWILWFAPGNTCEVIHYLDCRPGCILVSVLSRTAQIFSVKSWILLDQSHIATALREEDMISEGIIKEVMFSSGFKICFVRFHSLALRPNALLCLTLAGSTGTAGPPSNSQLPSSATLKKFLLSAFFISNVCELRFCLFFNQKNF